MPAPGRGRPHRRHAIALLALGPLLAGCEALERMDYLDRIFEPERFARPVPAAQPQPEPLPPAASEPSTETVVAMEPLPDPAPLPARQRAAPPPAAPEPAALTEVEGESRLRSTVRRNPWLTRFWSELTAAQQLRVERQLRRAENPPAAEPAGAWDSMGLADRARLVFGDRPGPEAPDPSERREGSNWASRP